MITLYDATQFIGKPGGNGYAGSGCIPGAIKLELNKPHDTYAHDGSGDTLIHVEPGKDADFTTKAGVKAAKVTLGLLSDKAAREHPTCKQWWYCPPLLRAEWLAASLGDKRAQAAIKAWRSSIYDLTIDGIPGPRVHGVCVDLYDFESIKTVWRARVAENIKPWLDARRPVLPILYLRWKDTGILYTEEEVRDRIGFAASLCGGRCAIFDGFGPTGAIETYQSWWLRPVIEQMTGAANAA